VHAVYQTSGNIAVFDDDAVRFCLFVIDHLRCLGPAASEALKASEEMLVRIRDHISKKCAANGWVDSKELLDIKANIRRQEAAAAARYCGVLPECIHFLNLPFYQTGTIAKNPITETDVRIVLELLRKVRPQQIYAAGDLSDPHGTHRMCLKALLKAVEAAKDDEWMKECQIWLYRGAWQEWEPEKVEMSVPMSPEELYRKRLAIFRHQSQKDPPPFPGSDSREFWQRSEARNKDTAQLFDRLGLPEFEAIETFVRYDPNALLSKVFLN
jgi:glucosamine-6-phosphate deaminase